MSNTSIHTLVTAVLTPDTFFILLASSDKSSVLPFISSRRLAPLPYCIVSEAPLRLSSTKLLSYPDLVLYLKPSSPLALDAISGIATPTHIYAISAISASDQ